MRYYQAIKESAIPLNIDWKKFNSRVFLFGEQTNRHSTHMIEKQGESGIVSRFSSRGIFPHQFAFTLLIPLRNLFLSPKQLIKRLDIQDDMHVMEVGPGPGYFSIKIAQKLTLGRLVLADIQQEMLDHARKRLEKRSISNVSYYLCDGKSFEFPDNSFDRIFMVTVIGEVENKTLYFQEFRRLLKSDGLLSISEQAGDPDKMTMDEIREIAMESGFTFHKMYGTQRNYTLNFVKSK